ncbi:MAG: hypothetical protein MJK04_27760 [Psychrosphaera sp.]|nr:hypothetical protein [Psychrosphaera sp.]
MKKITLIAGTVLVMAMNINTTVAREISSDVQSLNDKIKECSLLGDGQKIINGQRQVTGHQVTNVNAPRTACVKEMAALLKSIKAKANHTQVERAVAGVNSKRDHTQD